MRSKPGHTAIVLLIALLSPDFSPFLSAQTALPTPAQLDQLLAPIALYPDSLLSQITTASTNPQEILDVANWLQQNSGLTGTALTDAAQKAGFDPAFIALVVFPQVLYMMAEHIDDYAAIGEAFSADQASVAASVQRLRAQAYVAGALRSNSQQQVEVQQQAGQTIYVIQPANPQVVYVPQYNPTVVYVQPSISAVVPTSLISFGAGIAIGALIANNQPWGWGGWGWNWGSRRVYYNHAVWVGWGNPYRPPNVWYRPRPVPYRTLPGYGGNWHYRPPNYRPPYRPNPPGYHRPAYSPPNRPGYRTPNGTRPPVQPSRPGAPNRPSTQPSKPANPRPPTGNRPTPPGSPSRPQTQPFKPAPKPATGQARPAGSTAQPKPAHQSRRQPHRKPAPRPPTAPRPQL